MACFRSLSRRLYTVEAYGHLAKIQRLLNENRSVTPLERTIMCHNEEHGSHAPQLLSYGANAYRKAIDTRRVSSF